MEQFWVDKENELLPIRVIVVKEIKEITIKALDKGSRIKRHSPVPMISLMNVGKGLQSIGIEQQDP